jgi:Uma2 family endonuclease
MIDKIVINNFPDMTDEEFYLFCLSNQQVQIERNEQGEIELMAAAGGDTGAREIELQRQVANWNHQYKLGVAFSPTTGFLLKHGAMRQPDVAWIRLDRWNALTAEQREKFVPIPPDFVAELRSTSDSVKPLQEKMERWMENDVKLAWLIDPKEQTSYIYRANGERIIVKGFDKTLSGEDVLVGFELNLSDLK